MTSTIFRASGLEFALLPPDDAIGNFAKAVQRILAKSVLDRGSARSASEPRRISKIRFATADQQIADRDLHGLSPLVRRRRSHLDQPLIGPRLRRPDLQDLTLHAQLVAGTNR